MDACITKMQEQLDMLSPKDRRLFNAIVFGVFRHRNLLDRMIKKHSNLVFQKISSPIVYILRAGLFQLSFMEKIPDFAAIDTSVSLAKKFKGKKTAGFVNAVLRSTIREGSHTQIGSDLNENSPKHIAVKYSLPNWLVKKWTNQFGLKPTVRLAQRINTIPDLTLRTNSLKTTRSALCETLDPLCASFEKTDYGTLGIRLKKPVMPVHQLEAFKNGWFQVQDEAAQIVTQVLAPEPGETVLDACAGLGGKTNHMAQIMANQGSVTATDIDAAKLAALTQEADRLGIENINVRPMDVLTSDIKSFDGYFDRALVDAPCSGLGVLQRNPDAKWRRRKSDIPRLAARQKKLLNSTGNLLAAGGTLVYAVCSCEREENEDVIFSFLKKRKDFSIDTEFQFDAYSDLLTQDGFIKTYPTNDCMDGFFVARLKRKL